MTYKRYKEELRKQRVKRLGEASGSRSGSKSRDTKKKKKVKFYPIIYTSTYITIQCMLLMYWCLYMYMYNI